MLVILMVGLTVVLLILIFNQTKSLDGGSVIYVKDVGDGKVKSEPPPPRSKAPQNKDKILLGYTIVSSFPWINRKILWFTRKIYENEEIAQQAIDHINRDLKINDRFEIIPVYVDPDIEGMKIKVYS